MMGRMTKTCYDEKHITYLKLKENNLCGYYYICVRQQHDDS